MPASTANWEFHRANFARNRPNYTIEEREFNFEVRHSPMPPDGTLRIP